jgi:hypothetical protein
MAKRFTVCAQERSCLTTTIEHDEVTTEQEAIAYAMEHAGVLAWDEDSMGIEDFCIEGEELPAQWPTPGLVERWQVLFERALQGLADNDDRPRDIANQAAAIADHALDVEVARLNRIKDPH